jgi:hypothetical protein
MRNRKKNSITLLIAFLCVYLIYSYLKSKRNNSIIDLSSALNITEFVYELSYNHSNIKNQNDKPKIFIFNLSKPLEPDAIYDSIKCRKSLDIYVRTMLCVHDTRNDIHVSGSIWRK